MTITTIQGLRKEGNQKKIIVKVLVAMWCSEILDCVLNLHVYFH